LKTFTKRQFIPKFIQVSSHELPDLTKLQNLMVRKNPSKYDILVSMKNVRVAYGETIIFEKINWTVRPGDRWCLSGPNGSGKSTLLSLINGDHPQAYANEIWLFDRKRGSGESIWDIKKKIGFMSPELYQYFPFRFNGLQVVESGFYDSIGLFGQSRRENRDIAEQWMAVMGLSSIQNTRLAKMSTSHQRLCLLARAIVKNPYLLLLDEPCLGFDQIQQNKFKYLIDTMAKFSDMAIIYVTHHQESLPECITKTLSLEK
jgi:molybdate transport system ATP-binding protein